jgi:hypothetical protein
MSEGFTSAQNGRDESMDLDLSFPNPRESRNMLKYLSRWDCDLFEKSGMHCLCVLIDMVYEGRQRYLGLV